MLCAKNLFEFRIEIDIAGFLPAFFVPKKRSNYFFNVS